MVLLVYKSGGESCNDLQNFPFALWDVVQSSADNLSPRGLQNMFATNVEELDKFSIDNFLLSTRRQRDEKDSARTAEEV